MRITNLRVETFKSLYDVDVSLEDFNVLTGPNASGKSNLVDALRFLGDTYTHGLEFAVSRAGGIENIAHRRTRRAKKSIAFQVTGVIDAKDHNYWYLSQHDADQLRESHAQLIIQHSFSFRTATQTVRSDYVVDSEEVLVFDADNRLLARLSRKQQTFSIETYPKRSGIWRKRILTGVMAPFSDNSYKTWVQARHIPTALMFIETAFPATVVTAFARYVGNIGIFQLSPHLSRAPGVPTPNAQLELHGENLPGAAFNLMRSNRPEWSKVQDAMKLLLPNLESIEVANTEDRRLALQFHEKGVGRAWTAGEVSDGTIQTLALLVALFDPRIPLLVIEEPENAIHPWILRNFLDLCRASEKQILLTSHSPILLNYVEPQVVQLMWMQAGRSSISPLLAMDAEASAALLSGEFSVFDLYDSGMIRQAVPRGLGSLEDDA